MVQLIDTMLNKNDKTRAQIDTLMGCPIVNDYMYKFMNEYGSSNLTYFFINIFRMTLNGTSRISLTQAYVLSQDEKELLENCSRLCYNFVDTTDDLTSSFVPSNSHQDFGSLGKEIISQSASSTNGIIL